MRLNIFILGLLISFVTVAQKSIKYKYNGNKYYCYIIEVNNDAIGKLRIIENDTGIPHKKLVEQIKSRNKNTFLTTASSVKQNYKPVGLYIDNYVERTNINLANGNGNFYLKPNGVLVVTNNTIDVCQTAEINKYNSLKYAIQSGPMLVTNKVINENFNINSVNKRVRSAVGVFTKKNKKYIVFSLSAQKVTFYDFSEFFLNKLHCDNALCLESVRSVMSIPRIKNKTDNTTDVTYRYIIYEK